MNDDQDGRPWDVAGPFRIYVLERGSDRKATVVTLPNGKCVVSWPTSTIVYDSEDAARAVHIEHMGGRGEPTTFEIQHREDVRARAAVDCCQDHCENVPFASVGGHIKRGAMVVPHYIAPEEAADYLGGYVGQAYRLYGPDWQTCNFGWSPALTVNK